MATSFPAYQVVVVGGGLAGFTAAATALELGANVVIIDKMGVCGGNSTKAVSGINGVLTPAQKQAGIVDSQESFEKDMMMQQAKPCEFARVISESASDAYNWLCSSFNLDLSHVTRIGGHSVPRTHRGPSQLPGVQITLSLVQSLEAMQRKDAGRCRILTHATVTRLLVSSDGSVFGVEYESQEKQLFREIGAVIICTGGFAADNSSSSLLAATRPDLANLPTSNGSHACGDGIKLAMAVGADTVDLDNVQLNPSGIVDPQDPQAQVKALAAEVLRGEGALLLNSGGRRFCNETGTLRHITSEMSRNTAPFYLVVNSNTTAHLSMHCALYESRGLFKKANVSELAELIKVSVDVLRDTFLHYNDEATRSLADPDGGPFVAASGRHTFDVFGKDHFPTLFDPDDVFLVGQVTPVVHRCNGGLAIDRFGRVLRKKGKRPIRGLWAAGEVVAGVPGQDSLGGNPLLECVVYGRIAATSAVTTALPQSQPFDLKSLLPAIEKVEEQEFIPHGQYAIEEVQKHNRKGDCWIVVNGKILDVSKFSKDHPGGEMAILTMAGKDASAEFNMIHPPDVIEKYAPYTYIADLWIPKPKVVVKSEPTIPSISLAEVAKHTTKGDCWIAVNGQVLNVTAFLKDHPGGELPILTFAGKDASKEFNMIHPPDVISKYAPYAVIGKLQDEALPSAVGGLSAPLLTREQWWGPDRLSANEYGPFGPSMTSVFRALWSSIYLILAESGKTVFTANNLSIAHDKSGLTRSATFLIFYVVVHALGNLHVFAGPDAFNGYAYFLNHPVKWGALALPFELYLLICAIVHVSVATIRTIKFKSMSMLWDTNLRGQLSLAVTGAFLFLFLVIHIAQFRLPSTYPLYAFRTKWMYPFYCDLEDDACEASSFKDLYKMEFDLFSSGAWVTFYLLSVIMFMLHASEGWVKMVSVSNYISRRDKHKASVIGKCLAWGVGLCYLSFPVYCYMYPIKDARAYDQRQYSARKMLGIEV